jgi:hypothetical protein
MLMGKLLHQYQKSEVTESKSESTSQVRGLHLLTPSQQRKAERWAALPTVLVIAQGMGGRTMQGRGGRAAQGGRTAQGGTGWMMWLHTTGAAGDQAVPVVELEPYG